MTHSFFEHTEDTVDNELRNADGRNFDHYGAEMDAGLAYKLAEIVPYVLPGLIVDAGFGTGALLEALADRFPESKLVGIDFSAHFVAQAHARFRDQRNVSIVRADARALGSFWTAGASTVIFSSILHEVHSLANAGYDETPVLDALKAAATTLVPGGSVIIRDGVAPSRAAVALWCNPDDGTRDWFYRFAREYRHGVGVPFDPAIVAGRECFVLRGRDAYEFMSKKDYREHWELEVQEEYGFWRRSEWERGLREARLHLDHYEEILNPWILENRFRGTVALYDPVSGAEIPFFPTHVLIAASRP